jgi:RinA family phage transcriptional activator
MRAYKFDLNPRIKAYVEWQLEHYHEDKKQLEEIKGAMMPQITTSYGTGGHGNAISTPTEDAAMRMATNAYIQSTERSVRAIEHTLARCDSTSRALIDMVYWKRTMTATGAAMRCNVSKSSAYRKINFILTSIALELGLLNEF